MHLPLPDPGTLSREELEAEVRRLRGHSASLAQMFEQAPSFVALLSGPEHRFTLTNAAYQRMVDGRYVAGRTVAAGGRRSGLRRPARRGVP